MLDTPKKLFLVIGALEAAAQILGFIGAAKLPGEEFGALISMASDAFASTSTLDA